MKHIWQITLLLSIIVSNVTLFAAQDPDKPHARTGTQAEQAEPASKRQRTEEEQSSLSLASEVAMHEAPVSAPQAVSTEEQRSEFWNAIKTDNVQKIVAHFTQFPQDIELKNEGLTTLMFAIRHTSFQSFLEILNRVSQENISKGFLDEGKDSSEQEEDDDEDDDEDTGGYNDRAKETALFYAARKKNPLFAQLLLERGARVDVGNKHGTTPLMRASEDVNVETIKLLLLHGANINAVNSFNSNALHVFIYSLDNGHSGYGCYRLDQKHKETLQLLLDRGINIDQEDCGGNTPLMLAASGGLYEVVVTLVEASADITVLNKKKQQAIDVARRALEQRKGNKHSAGNTMFYYKKIVQCLSKPLEYTRAREAERELLALPKVVTDIIGGYFTGSTEFQQDLLNDIKYAIRSNDTSRLIELLNESPQAISKTDEGVDTPLTFAIKWEKSLAVEIILGILDKRINKQIERLDKGIKGMKDSLDSLRNIKKDALLTDEQIKIIKEKLALKRQNLGFYHWMDKAFAQINIATAQGKAALIQLDTRTNYHIGRHYTEKIQELNQEKQGLLLEQNKELSHALGVARSLSNQEVQSRANQEIIELVDARLHPEVPSAPSVPASANVLPLNMLPLELIQQLKLHTKAAIEQVGLHLKDHPEDLNGVDRFGNTPLMIAAEGEDEVLIATLLELGANRTLRNNAEESAFDLVDQRAAPEANEARRQLLERLKNMLR